MSWATVTSKQNGGRSNRPPDTMRNPKYMSERDRGPHTTPRHDRYTRNYSPHTANSPSTGSGSSFSRDHTYNAEKRGGYKSFSNRFASDDTNYQSGFQNVVSYGADSQFSDSLFHQEPAPPEFGLPDQKEVAEPPNSRYKRQDELWSGKSSPSASARDPTSTSGKWKSRRVEEQKRQLQEDKKKRSWWYLDPQQEVQGPFGEEEMKEWFNEGFFGVDLPVRCHPDTLFVPLGDWFRQGNSAFLEEIPEEHRGPKSAEDNSNANTQPVSHSPRTKPSNPVSVLNNQANSSNLAMSSLSGVIEDSSKPHVQPQAFSSRQVTRHNQFPPPTGSTLNMNAPAFNPMGSTERYKPPPSTSNLNAKPTLPPQSNDPNLFSHYRNQERTKQEASKPAKGGSSSYTTQHDLRPNTSTSSATFDTGHNPLQTNAHPRPPMVSGVGNMRFGTTQQNGFDGALGGIATNPSVSSRNTFGYGGTTSGSDMSRTNSNLAPPEDKGGWKEIGTIASPHSRQDSNLSSPFGSGTIGSDPYAHIPLKHATEPKGSVSPWARPAIMTSEVKKTQSEINEQPENDSLRRTNEHAQIQRQRSPQENSRNFNWGLNGTANNHNQRQQQQNRDKRISSNAQKPPLVNKLKEDAKPRQASSSWASASNTANSSWDTRPPRIPQVRNQVPTNQSSRGSPGGSNRQMEHYASKLDDQMSGSHSSKSTSANSSVLTQSIGSKNSSARSTNTRKPLIKGDPTMSSNRTNASSKGKSKNADTNSFGVKISSDFEEWCLKHINECAAQTGEDLDARALIHFLMTLSRKDEIREYIVNYLGDSPKVQEFADGFIQLKNFETTTGESTFQESKRSRRKRRRNKKTGTSS